jgi:Guanylate-kinase-associated protein (GKAP) protein
VSVLCLICERLLQEELSNEGLPEEARDNILATVGQAKLLMAQKLAQFSGLNL